jgi:hypothetical protein
MWAILGRLSHFELLHGRETRFHWQHLLEVFPPVIRQGLRRIGELVGPRVASRCCGFVSCAKPDEVVEFAIGAAPNPDNPQSAKKDLLREDSGRGRPTDAS